MSDEEGTGLWVSARSTHASTTCGGSTGPGIGQEDSGDLERSQPLLLNSSIYLRSSGDRGGVTSSRPHSPDLLLSGRKGELSIKRWKSLIEQTDFAL